MLQSVLNLHHLNKFLRKDTFKYEDLRVATLMGEKEDFLFKFDLKSSYHHVDFFEDHQKYLGLKCELQGIPKISCLKSSLFELATACYAFTIVEKTYIHVCIVKHWRGRELRAVV